MKHLNMLLILILANLSIISCKEKIEVHNYVVTPEIAKSIDKPEVHFKANYPKTLVLENPTKNGSSFGMFQEKNTDGLVTEMCSLGYVKIDGLSLQKESRTFLNQIKNMLDGAGYTIEESKIGNTTFDGQTYLSLNLIGSMKPGVSDMFSGRYYFNTIIRPNPNSNTHILFLMAARDDQGINSYKDFADKLSISTIWQTFKYLD